MDVMSELEKAGAVLLDRHFVYTSGKHGSGYINMDPLFTNIQLMRSIGYELSRPFWRDGYDTVVAPATGGIVVAMAVVDQSKIDNAYPALVWADKHGDDFVIERAGFADHIRDKRVLVVEDLLNTGGSVVKVCNEVERLGGYIVGVSVIVKRSGITNVGLGVNRLGALANVEFEAVSAENCSLCAGWQPIVEDIGHGAEYKELHTDYRGGFVKLL